MPNENIEALLHFVDEINRCPTPIQNQFLRTLDGWLQFHGQKLSLGKDGYSLGIATANLGNGELPGTFAMDWALYDRMGLILDFDYEQFKPTREDVILRGMIRNPDSKTKDSPIRDISSKIIKAEKEISKNSRNLGLEAEAVINYLRFGLDNCFNEKYGSKEKNWPMQCQDCDKAENNSEEMMQLTCSLVRNPEGRLLETLPKYSAALDYLIKLKNPNSKHNAIDLVFKVFELTGAYQNILNPTVLRGEYFNQNPKMAKEVTDALKNDFLKNKDFILTSLDRAKDGNDYDDYFRYKKKIGFGYSKLKPKVKKQVEKLTPFSDDRVVGLSWVKNQAELYKTLNELNKNRYL